MGKELVNAKFTVIARPLRSRDEMVREYDLS